MKKVLIVDDLLYMCMFVKKIIKKDGLYLIFEVLGKEEVVEIYKIENLDIVILDLNMFEFRKDGIDVLIEIMNINFEVVVIIILVVGYEEVKDECIVFGVKSYIRKLFDI